MIASRARLFVTTLIAFSFAAAAHAGTISGVVINRTTGKPAPNIALDLLSPTQGMAELATATSDSNGRFSVTKDSIGGAPILIRATFHDVSFNTFSPPGRPNVEVEVFDISKDPKTITVPSHIVIFQPQDGKLVGAEEYQVSNVSQPAAAYFRTEGNFDFAIPENATMGQVTTTTTMGMSVAQAAIEKGKGRFAIAFAFRPGQTNVRLSYELPYPNNSASIKLPATYAGTKLLVVAPPGIAVSADGLVSAGQEQGMMVYTHDPLPIKGVLAVNLSGVGAAAPDSGGQGGAQEGNSRTGGQEVIAAPSRLDDFKWFIFAGLAALFAMGALLLSRKQVVAVEAGDAVALAQPAGIAARPAKAAKPQKKVVPPPPPVPASTPANVAIAVDQHVSVSMDSLKDQIFRLELRKQAGTISEEDYAREKAKVEKLLRDLVQG